MLLVKVAIEIWHEGNQDDDDTMMIMIIAGVRWA